MDQDRLFHRPGAWCSVHHLDGRRSRYRYFSAPIALRLKKPYILLIPVALMPVLVFFYRFNPEMYGFFPKCPFRVLTGFDCPGCGSQRAIHALLHADVSSAADYNLLLVLSLPLLITHFFYRLLSLTTGKNYRLELLYKPVTPVIIFILVLAFWIMRNLDTSPFTYLAS